MELKSTPASRWAKNYKRKYWYGIGTGLVLIGLLFMVVPTLGIPIASIGGFIYKNHKYWEKNANKNNNKKTLGKK